MSALKLVRIEHVRCGDYDGDYSFVLAPVEWDKDDIYEHADEARTEYIKDFAAAKTLPGAPPKPGYLPDYKAHPDLTVAEVEARHARQTQVYTEWNKRRGQLSKRFEDYLSKHGFTSIYDGAEETYLDWGHAHGSAYVYGGEEPNKKGLPSPMDLLDRWRHRGERAQP